MFSRSSVSRSPLFSMSNRASSKAPTRLQSILYFNPKSFTPREIHPLTTKNCISELKAHMQPGWRMQRTRGLGRKVSDMLVVNADNMVVARLRVPLCMVPQTQLPPGGFTVDQFEEHIAWAREEKRHVFMMACRKNAVGFCEIDLDGEIVDNGLAKTFVDSGRSEDQRRNGEMQDHLVPCQRVHSTRYQLEVMRHLDDFEDNAIRQCRVFLVRHAFSTFNAMMHARKFWELEHKDGVGSEWEEQGSQTMKARYHGTMFSDPRWLDASTGQMKHMDFHHLGSDDIRLISVAGCTRHGAIDLV